MTPTSVSLPDSLEARYAEVCDRIARAAQRAGRDARDVLLVAVTKTADPEQIRALTALGHRDFGENRVQQFVHRAAMMDEYFSRLKVLPTSRKKSDENETLFRGGPQVDLIPTSQVAGARPIRWHMIGHLQRNKARKIVEFVRLIHSVDSLRLAEELQLIANKRDEVVEVLVQVNCSGEASKFGCPVPAAIPLAEQIETMVNVRVRGLMTMAPLGTTAEAAPPTFVRCRELFEEMSKLRISDGKFNILSMGMSGDFEAAIAEGANIVRIGSAIFGEGRPELEEPEADD